MAYSKDYLYTKEHEWIKVDGKTGIVGITQYAVDQLGDVVHLELPKVGTKFRAGETFGSIESTKTVSDLYMPVNGVVTAVNTDLTNAPEHVTEDPHGKAWLLKIEIEGTPAGLLAAADYEKYIADESNH